LKAPQQHFEDPKLIQADMENKAEFEQLVHDLLMDKEVD
jgi:hypothetical protein